MGAWAWPAYLWLFSYKGWLAAFLADGLLSKLASTSVHDSGDRRPSTRGTF